MKKKYIFIIMFMMLCLPVSAKAASVSVSLSCPSSAKASSVVSCTIKATPSGSNLKGIQANINITNGTYSSLTLDSNWTPYSNNSSGFSLSRNTIATASVTVGTLKVKMPTSGNLNVKLSNVSGSDSNYATLNGNSPSASIRVQSTTNTLKTLTISNGTLSPNFSSNTTNYSATIDATSVTISATTTDTKAKVTGTGTKKLNYGTNKFNIVVTSEAGTTKTYSITITRPDKRSTNNNLKSLSSNQGNISFNKNTTTYNLTVEANVSSIKIDATVEDSKASFEKNYGPRTVNLNYGKNIIQIKVKAENGSIKTYTLNVTRKDNRSTNNYLKELTLSSGDIVFNKETLEYNTTVYYDITKINVVATPEDSKAKVVVNSPNLNVGNNVITINVTSENGQIRTYKIIVKRLTEEEKMSDNNNISSLKVLGHDINFQNDILEYDLTIKDEYALVFEVSLEDQKANYQIEGNEALKDGSIIKVVSTSESGLDKEYKFNIKKEIIKEEIKEDNTKVYIFGIGGFFLGVIITLIISSLIRKTKSNKKDN